MSWSADLERVVAGDLLVSELVGPRSCCDGQSVQYYSAPCLEQFDVVGYAQYSYMSDSNYVPSDFDVPQEYSTSYIPAQMSPTAFFRGLAKYARPHYMLPQVQINSLLEWMDMGFGTYLEVEPWTKSQALYELDQDKAAGLPWKLEGLTKKGQVLVALASKHNVVTPGNADSSRMILQQDSDMDVVYDDLQELFERYWPVASGNLKAEIRAKEKAERPRLFLPMPIQAIAVGNRLFGAQNRELATTHCEHPITVGIQNPGRGIHNLFQILRSWTILSPTSGCGDGDHGSFDAVVNLSIITVICELRKRHLPTELHGLVDRYYQVVYQGIVMILGNLIHVIGQRSGQTNTSMDNSLVSVSMFYLHGIELGWTYQEFTNRVLVFVNGDDVIWSSRVNFSQTEMRNTAALMGHYLETSPDEFKTVDECQFIGMTPIVYSYGGHDHRLYVGRVDKILSSLRWWRTKTSVADHFQKLVALCTLLFPKPEYFYPLRKAIFEWVKSRENEIGPRVVRSARANLRETSLFHLYLSSETGVIPSSLTLF